MALPNSHATIVRHNTACRNSGNAF